MTPGPQASIPAGSPGEGAGFPCCGGTGMALAGYGDMVSQDGLAPCPDCTGAAGTADAPGERDGAVSGASVEPAAPVSPHAGVGAAGGAGTYGDGTAWGEAALVRSRWPLVLACAACAAWIAFVVLLFVA